MKKYNIDFKNSSMLNFEELYTAVMKKTRHIKFKHSFMKTMRESALEKLNHQKELLMKIDAVIIHADGMLLSPLTAEPAEKSKLKTIPNAVIQHQLDDLNLKAEILQSNILSLSESL